MYFKRIAHAEVLASDHVVSREAQCLRFQKFLLVMHIRPNSAMGVIKIASGVARKISQWGQKSTPSVSFELTTFRLTAERSANWANQEDLDFCQNHSV